MAENKENKTKAPDMGTTIVLHTLFQGRYFKNFDFTEVERKKVPGKPNSMRLTYPAPFSFNVVGYSKGGIDNSEYSQDKYWIRLTYETKDPTKAPGPVTGFPNLFDGLRNIDNFLHEGYNATRVNLDALPTWFKETREMKMKTGLDAAQLIDGCTLSYSFYLHSEWTQCTVSQKVGGIKRVPILSLKGQSGNSFFALELTIKMVDYVYNEVTNRIDVTGFINVKRATMMDFGQDKTPLVEDVSYRDVKEAEELENLSVALRPLSTEFEKFYEHESLGNLLEVTTEKGPEKSKRKTDWNAVLGVNLLSKKQKNIEEREEYNSSGCLL